MEEMIKGKVVQIIDEYKLVINKGSADGVKDDHVFLVYELGNEIFDPDTGKSLGILELVRGEGKARHVQEHLTTLESNTYINNHETTVIKRPNWFNNIETQEIRSDPKEQLPFENPNTDCLVKRIK